MQKFIIGKDNFGVGKTTYKVDIENSMINNLTIIGDQGVFNHLSAGRNDHWSWTLYPPEFYMRQIPYRVKENKIQVNINADTPTDKCEVALYCMGHNYIEGTGSIDENEIFFFDGIADLFGEKMTLKLEVNLNSTI